MTAGAFPERLDDLSTFAAYLPRLCRLSGLDLRCYRLHYLHRRLLLAVRRAGCPDLPAYIRWVERAADPRPLLREALTIDVSEFFRDASEFAPLMQEHLPALLTRTEPLRVWSAGCSTGAELYSLAICLALVTGSTALRPHVLLGTDINEQALAQAQAGIYQRSDLKQVPLSITKRFFAPVLHRFRVDADLAGSVDFRVHDVLTDPPGGRWNIIACRNVAIYLQAHAQQALYATLSSALEPGGLLFIGTAEHLPRPADLGLERLRPHLYRRRHPSMLQSHVSPVQGGETACA